VINRGAQEVAGDDVDGNCDGAELCYADRDLDGVVDVRGPPVESVDLDCDDPGEGGGELFAVDCDDTDPSVFPGAEEILDGIDNDCDGRDETWDTDGDGLSDYDERILGTSLVLADTDLDGLDDGDEVALGADPLVGDTDGDGLLDGDEVAAGASPVLVDTDGDGLLDPDEVDRGTDPANADTDGDGRSDGDEVEQGRDPLTGRGCAVGGGSGAGGAWALALMAWRRRRTPAAANP
jgi:hypothetical protein